MANRNEEEISCTIWPGFNQIPVILHGSTWSGWAFSKSSNLFFAQDLGRTMLERSNPHQTWEFHAAMEKCVAFEEWCWLTRNQETINHLPMLLIGSPFVNFQGFTSTANHLPGNARRHGENKPTNQTTHGKASLPAWPTAECNRGSTTGPLCTKPRPVGPLQGSRASEATSLIFPRAPKPLQGAWPFWRAGSRSYWVLGSSWWYSNWRMGMAWGFGQWP